MIGASRRSEYEVSVIGLPDNPPRNRSATAQVAAGGRVIYSTCSLEGEENEDVVERLLKENSSFRVIDCRAELERLQQEGELICSDPSSLTRGPYLRTLPGVHPCEGFFAAILEKT